jgi:hypothetical protein
VLAGLAGLPALLARVNPEKTGRIDGEAAIAARTQAPPELIGTVLDLAAALAGRSRDASCRTRHRAW